MLCTSPVGPFFVCHGVRGPGGGVIGEPTFFNERTHLCQLFRNGRRGEGHCRTENCTEQVAPPEATPLFCRESRQSTSCQSSKAYMYMYKLLLPGLDFIYSFFVRVRPLSAPARGRSVGRNRADEHLNNKWTKTHHA